MEDKLLEDLINEPGEIFYIPELQTDYKFDVEGYIKVDTDYAW